MVIDCQGFELLDCLLQGLKIKMNKKMDRLCNYCQDQKMTVFFKLEALWNWYVFTFPFT